jgi:ADP-heptose:LPS heptosyltransferase
VNLERAKIVDRTLGAALASVLAAVRRVGSGRGEVGEVRSILLVKLWGMGNIVLLGSVVRMVREAHPDARITFLTLAANGELLERLPSIDRVVTLDIASWPRLITGLPGLLRTIRGERPDLVLDFEQFCHVSGILTALSGAPQTIGFRLPGRGRGRIYNVGVPYREERHMGAIFADIARAAGAPPTPYRLEPIPLRTEDESEADAVCGGEAHGGIVAMHPGSGDNFPGRRWPVDSFAELALVLLRDRRGLRIVLTGGAGEEELVERVRARLADKARASVPADTAAGILDRVRNAAGRTTPCGLAALLARSRLVVSNDTGPVHLAGAMGTPVFAFFGPNTPLLYGPTGPGSRSFHAGLPCSPCLTNVNGKSSTCRRPVCMHQVTVREVVEAIESSDLLGARDPLPDAASREGAVR